MKTTTASTDNTSTTTSTSKTTSTAQSNKNINNNNNMNDAIMRDIQRLDVNVIHRVLLTTEPSEWSSNLTMSGLPRVLDTMDYNEFVQEMEGTTADGNTSSSCRNAVVATSYDDVQFASSLLSSKNHQIRMVVKRAFRDHLLEHVLSSSSSHPLRTTTTTTTAAATTPTLATTTTTVPEQDDVLVACLLELHEHIRSLVPNRLDLHHTVLDDQTVRNAAATHNHNMVNVLDCLIRAASDGLQHLESEARAETTLAWIELAKQHHQQQQASTTRAEFCKFVVTSLLYLLYKCELCQSDKDDFYLSHVYAPRIHRGNVGVELERQAFLQRHHGTTTSSSGQGNDPWSNVVVPHTRTWIRTLVRQNISILQQQQPAQDDVDGNRAMPSPISNTIPTTTTTGNTADKLNLLRTGWMEDIVFRSMDQPSLLLPEVLELDFDRLEQIRQLTQRAAAGSALILLIGHVLSESGECVGDRNHATATATTITTISTTLQTPAPPYSASAMRQYSLMQALHDHVSSSPSSSHRSSVEEYETNVVNQVLALAMEYQRSIVSSTSSTRSNVTFLSTSSDTTIILTSSQQEALTHRTLAVLRGKDPVVQVLHQRMRRIFSQLMIVPPMDGPSTTTSSMPTMRSGRLHEPLSPSTLSSTNRQDRWNAFLDRARSQFTQRGFGLYANSLANAAKMARKTIDLVWTLYGDVLLDNFITEAMVTTTMTTMDGP